MVDGDTLGKRLKSAREQARLTQQQVGARLSAHAVSVSNWERDVNVPAEDTLTKLAELYGVAPATLRYGTTDVHGARQTGEGTNGDRPADVPLRRHAVRVWLREFELELVRAGATDDEIANARTLLTRPEALTFYVGGHSRDATEEETLMGMEAMAEFIRDRLTLKGRKFK